MDWDKDHEVKDGNQLFWEGFAKDLSQMTELDLFIGLATWDLESWYTYRPIMLRDGDELPTVLIQMPVENVLSLCKVKGGREALLDAYKNEIREIVCPHGRIRYCTEGCKPSRPVQHRFISLSGGKADE